MDRDRFESELDRLISAHDRKVCAEIDAGACRTPRDFRKMHEAQEAYEEAREAFLGVVFAPPSPPLPPVVAAREEQVRGTSRGRPLVWRRWIEVRIVWRSAVYVFTADAAALAAEVAEEGDFDPLDLGHSICFRGVEYRSSEPGPPALVRMAIEACRAVASRLVAHGVDTFAIRRSWPEGAPSFEDLVRADAPLET